jgi:hypothetical protein
VLKPRAIEVELPRQSFVSRSAAKVEKMIKFRKKPVVIEARQVSGHGKGGGCNCHELVAWIGNAAFVFGDGVAIDTLEGQMTAEPGDWIIKGVKGEFYPCKPDVFAATYDPIPSDSEGVNLD